MTQIGYDLLETNPVTGERTGLSKTIRRALRAIDGAGIRYSVIGATALAVRGLPRMTADLDLVVMLEDASTAVSALESAQLRASTPIGTDDDPEPMVVFVDGETGVEVDLLIAAGDPEATVVDEATVASVFGVEARVATAEHLLLRYLYSKQPKQLGDFASIVTAGIADLAAAERTLLHMHPEMIAEWHRRVKEDQSPPPAPKRPPRRKR